MNPADRLRLAAYCGDKEALAALPFDCGVADRPNGGCGSDGRDCVGCSSRYPLDLWTRGLERFGAAVQIRAALAAARVALDAGEWDVCCDGKDCACRGMPIDPEWHHARHAIDAGDAWLRCPCDEHERAAMAARPTEAGECYGWLFDGKASQTGWPRLVIRDAARFVGDDRVRASIQAALLGVS